MRTRTLSANFVFRKARCNAALRCEARREVLGGETIVPCVGAIVSLMKGYGAGYKYAHEFEGHYVAQDYIPTAATYYEPTREGYEDIIGKRMAHVSRNVFRRVIACDPYIIDGDFPAFVERGSLTDVFAQSDIVSLHVPLNDETRGMIDAAVLGVMKPGGYLVNTSRGAVVDIDAALSALERGTLAGLGLDVLPVEPVPAGSRLLGHPRVILTPHAAFFSIEAERELRRKAAQNIVTWLKTGRPDYDRVRAIVDQEKLPVTVLPFTVHWTVPLSWALVKAVP